MCSLLLAASVCWTVYSSTLVTHIDNAQQGGLCLKTAQVVKVELEGLCKFKKSVNRRYDVIGAADPPIPRTGGLSRRCPRRHCIESDRS